MPRLYECKRAAHSPKNLSMILNVEVAEIVEYLTKHGYSNVVCAGCTETAQWLTGEQSQSLPEKALKEDEQATTKKSETIIKNTYRTLMTRGQKGCYLYCTDKETNDYFAQLAKDVINELTNEYIKK